MAQLKAVKLDPSNPHSALRCPSRPLPERNNSPRRLSDQQLKNPFIRAAHKRLSSISAHRGNYLGRLDTVHGDRRTRSEKWSALEQIAEQLLVRLDICESVLGYFDLERGRYVLNTQCRLAADAGISAPVLNRLMATLDEAGYVYRRIERVRLDEKDQNGLHLVRTRVLIRFTHQFWADLGLRYVFERCQKSAKRKRAIALGQLGQRRSGEMERVSLDRMRRERARAKWQNSELGKTTNFDAKTQSVLNDPELNRQKHQMIVAMAIERGITAREAEVIVGQLLQSAINKNRA